jgi:two-component system NtrC family sensor kinase
MEQSENKMLNGPMVEAEEGNILIVDDTPENLQVLSNTLSERGYKLRCVVTGQMALRAARSMPPDLILLDIRMPELNGYQVCEQLKADERLRDIPVIFLSAIDDVFDKVKAFSLGGVDYITKPFHVEEVLVHVKTHLALRNLQKSLEAKNEDLAKTLQQLQDTQNQLIQSEKLAALGQLVASIAHEINNPLGAIRSSSDNIAHFLEDELESVPEFFQQLSPRQQQFFLMLLRQSKKQKSRLSTKEKRQLRRTLIAQLNAHHIADAETMAALLVDIEVYDGLETVLPFLKESKSEDILTKVYQIITSKKSIRNIITATDQAAKVVFALKSYARYDATGEKLKTNIIDGIETALILYQNQFKQGVEVVRYYEDSLPSILCYPDELNQVWTNLIHNALQAMNNQGTLTINVTRHQARVVVSLTDSGAGIPVENQSKIFEPFFTTKPIGKGSGLGLYIVKKIVDKHEGTIEVQSIPGKTTFTVSLPIHITNETIHL